jgi:predicted phage terminase large subunit-like protein
MSAIGRDKLNQLLRDDFSFFLTFAFASLHHRQTIRWNWHLDAMCHALTGTADDSTKRLLITVPPRHLKSITVSVAFVAWMMGRDPSLKFLVTSYGGELALELARSFRTVVTAPWFKASFPGFKLARNIEGEIQTTMGGVRKAVSVGGAITGFGADYIIVDDLLKASDADSPGLREASLDYFRGSLISRLNDPDHGRIIVIAQRLHEYDVPGYCQSTGHYAHVNLPAIADSLQRIPLGPKRTKTFRPGDLLYFSQETLNRVRDEMGPAFFSAQYLQNPTPSESHFISWHKIARYKEAPPREKLLKVVQSWDTAYELTATADFSVCTTWGFHEGKWLLLDAQRFRADFAGLKDRAKVMRDRWMADILVIEDTGSGKTLLGELRFEAGAGKDPGGVNVRLHAYKPRASKEARWAAQAAKLEEGFAQIPEEAPWLDVLRREVCSFPAGAHDDQVDSISQFLDFSRMRTGRTLLQEYNDKGALRGRPVHHEDWDDTDVEAYWFAKYR